MRVDERKPSDDDDARAVHAFGADPLRRFLAPTSRYELTRFVILRLLGLVYFFAFLSLAFQLRPLLGSDGLLPIASFLAHVRGALGSPLAYYRLPTLFWFGASDAVLVACAWIGAAMSLAVCAGATNAVLQLSIWALYLSFVHVGQVFYGYGWEAQLCETGFLAIFLCPIGSIRPFAAPAPSRVVIVLFRWLTFRVMLGAGLIKLRGDPCWRDLTCLVYHYETQPVPSPVSWLLHQAPEWFHELGVLVNHAVELVVPFFVFGPRRARLVAGVLCVLFQITLILSGNLSFLNWLTIVPCLACFDDEALLRVVPRRGRARVAAKGESAVPASRAQRVTCYVLAFVVFVLSVNPVGNLLSPHQSMNTSFDPLDLVNTYGAFGSVGRERFEVILEGTSDPTIDEHTRWLAYELPCKPGDVHRRPCVLGSYHYRLDWQMWFAALSSYDQEPWIVHLVSKLLRGDRAVESLFSHDPFPGEPPRFVRAELYRYELTRFGDGSGAWWRRERESEYLPPLSANDPALLVFLAEHGWSTR